MKKLYIVMAAAGMMAGCQVSEENFSNGTESGVSGLKDGYGLLSVNISDWESEVMSTRSAVDASSSNVRFLSLKVFEGTGKANSEWGEAVYDTIQDKNGTAIPGTTFGTVNCELKAGTYTIVATGDVSGGTDITSPVLATAPMANFGIEWSNTSEVTIASGQENALGMTLPMAYAELCIESTTSQPTTANTLRVTVGDTLKSAFDKVKFNPSTRLALKESEGGADKYSIDRDISSTTKNTYTCRIPLWSADSAMVVKLEVQDASNEVIYEHTIKNVPFKLGCRTTCTGPLFDVPSSGTFLIEKDFIEEIDGGW